MPDTLSPDSAAGAGHPPPPPTPDEPTPVNATQRARWATRRMTVRSGGSKRKSLIDRMQQKKGASDEKDGGNGRDPASGNQTTPNNEENASDDGNESSTRTLYFNQPLPADMLDEEGLPLYSYPRNKIRTAKYTPLSFIPKNLWFQFHNIANIFFLFLIILVVSSTRPCSSIPSLLYYDTYLLPLDFPHLRWCQSGTECSSSYFHRYCDGH